MSLEGPFAVYLSRATPLTFWLSIFHLFAMTWLNLLQFLLITLLLFEKRQPPYIDPITNLDACNSILDDMLIILPGVSFFLVIILSSVKKFNNSR